MDSDFLTSFRHFLEYHPGNQDFLRKVQELSTASDASFTAVANAIVDSMVQESEMGLYRRFLYQNHTNGAWELVCVPEVEHTRRKVLLERDNTKHEQVQKLQHNLSVHRFGLHRESPTSTQAAQGSEAALDKLLECRGWSSVSQPGGRISRDGCCCSRSSAELRIVVGALDS